MTDSQQQVANSSFPTLPSEPRDLTWKPICFHSLTGINKVTWTQKESQPAEKTTTQPTNTYHPPPSTTTTTHNDECVCESWLQFGRTGCSWNVGWRCWRTSRRSTQLSHRTQEGKQDPDASWSEKDPSGGSLMTDRWLMINRQCIYMSYICHHLKKFPLKKYLWFNWEKDGRGVACLLKCCSQAQTMGAETGSLGLEVWGAATQPDKTGVYRKKTDLHDA